MDNNFVDNIIALLNRGITPSQEELKRALLIAENELGELTKMAYEESGTGKLDFEKLSQETKSALTICVLRRDKIMGSVGNLQ